MEASSYRKGEKEEEEVADERTASFYLCHPCLFLKEALNILFKCLGFEKIGTTDTKEHKSCCLVNKPPSDSEQEEHINTENNATKGSEEVPTTTEEEEAADSSTTQGFELAITSFTVTRRRPDLSQGRGGQTN